jgi:hypothetical protein
MIDGPINNEGGFNDFERLPLRKMLNRKGTEDSQESQNAPSMREMDTQKNNRFNAGGGGGTTRRGEREEEIKLPIRKIN